jgi:hypothetical protein
MEMTCEKIDGTKILDVKLTGEFRLDEAQSCFLDLLDSVKREKTDKVLVDGTAVTGKPEVFQRFLYAEFGAMAVSDFKQDPGVRNPKFAYALKPPVLDPRRFGETVALNRGMNIKAFESVQEAMDWLAG